DWIPVVAAMLAAGPAAGFAAGLFGIGGGFVVVPALFLVLPLLSAGQAELAHVAIGTSLATIVVTSLRSVQAHARRGAVDFDLLRSWAPWIVLGVGAGVVSNERLVAGAFGAGGEIGHITINLDETRTCGCGRKGCLEQYASAKGIVRLYLEECTVRGVTPAAVEHATDTLTVFKALAEGDDCARLAVHQMCEYLGLAMSQVSCVCDPALYLIGGGVAGGFATFAPDLRACFAKYALKGCQSARIEAASLGNQAAMYGCAYEALRLRG
ncbi:MAG TPA: ROK family protein, partial [Atopobiaceae bacterium]|nr:ROK family protein [Atopobiaceae bacterium]